MAAKQRQPTTTTTRVGTRKVATTPVAVAEPLRYVSIIGVADPVPLRFFGAPCPECGACISHGGAFLNHERTTIEFWRCAACGAYAFLDYPEIKVHPPGHP